MRTTLITGITVLFFTLIVDIYSERVRRRSPLWWDGRRDRVLSIQQNNNEFFVKLKKKKAGPKSKAIASISNAGGKIYGARVLEKETLKNFQGLKVKARGSALQKLKNDPEVEYVERIVPIHIEHDSIDHDSTTGYYHTGGNIILVHAPGHEAASGSGASGESSGSGVSGEGSANTAETGSDGTTVTTATSKPGNDNKAGAENFVGSKSCQQQKDPVWNLDRVDQESFDGDKTFSFNPGDGEGALVYVLDTGIDEANEEFGGRATFGVAICAGCAETDDHGHGTHVAGIAVGKSFGVARSAHVIGVKIFDEGGQGTSMDMIKGLQWVLEDCKKRDKIGKCVVNMSLGGRKAQHENDAVNDMVDAGIPVIAASGNEYDDACNFSPGSAEKAISVGSSDVKDYRSDFSNYGKCVDIFAPGDDIESVVPGGTKEFSGTSMACPHVAGATASYMASTGGTDGLWDWLEKNALRDKIKDTKESPNLLLYLPCEQI